MNRIDCILIPLLLGCLAAWRPAEAAQPPVWQMNPYRVQVLLAADADPQLNALRGQLPAAIATRCQSLAGGPWEVKVDQADTDLQDRMLRELENVAATLLPKPALEQDKVFLVAIARQKGGYEVAVRELDVRTGIFSAAVRRKVGQAGRVCEAILRGVAEAFAPLGIVHRVEDRKVTLRIRAGAIRPRDSQFAPSASGKVFLPVIRSTDAAGKTTQVAIVPWSFLTIEDVSFQNSTARLDTSLKLQLPTARGGGVEPLALGVVSSGEPTRLVFPAPAAGAAAVPYEVTAVAPGSGSAVTLGRTDAQGAVAVGPAASPLQRVRLQSGQQALAEFPIVPGMQPEMRVPASDEAKRLAAEAVVVALQDELLDLSTLRQVLIAQAQAQIQAKQWAEAKSTVNELQGLPRIAGFKDRVAAERKRATTGNAALQKTIDARFDAITKLADKTLDSASVQQLVDAVNATTR